MAFLQSPEKKNTQNKTHILLRTIWLKVTGKKYATMTYDSYLSYDKMTIVSWKGVDGFTFTVESGIGANEYEKKNKKRRADYPVYKFTKCHFSSDGRSNRDKYAVYNIEIHNAIQIWALMSLIFFFSLFPFSFFVRALAIISAAYLQKCRFAYISATR